MIADGVMLCLSWRGERGVGRVNIRVVAGRNSRPRSLVFQETGGETARLFATARAETRTRAGQPHSAASTVPTSSVKGVEGLITEKALEDMINLLCKTGRFKQALNLADGIVQKLKLALAVLLGYK